MTSLKLPAWISPKFLGEMQKKENKDDENVDIAESSGATEDKTGANGTAS